MAAQVPASLKAADIARFALRASQLEQAKPVVAYWCNYWIAQQILSKGLHNADQEALVYTTGLMDRLEQFKNANLTNDAVVDDIAGKAYIEQFGLETFDRAEKAVQANKASRQTADTYQASSTFLDLLEIWGPIEPEISKKSKYAKYHALRIAKALRAGEDPNLSNPVPEPTLEESAPPLDPNDPEVQMIDGGTGRARQPSVVEAPDEADKIQRSLAQQSSLGESLHPSRDASVQPHPKPRQPSAVEVPDENDKLEARLARQSSLDQSLHPSRDQSTAAAPKDRQPSVADIQDDGDKVQAKLARQSLANESIHPSRAQSGAVSPVVTDAAAFYTSQPADVSPISASERKPSVGGNYFPQMSFPTSSQAQPNAPPTLPSAPRDIGAADETLNLPSAPSIMSGSAEPSLPQPPTDFAQAQPPPVRTPLDSFLPPPAPGQPPLTNVPPNLLPSSQPPQSRPSAAPQLRQTSIHPNSPPVSTQPFVAHQYVNQAAMPPSQPANPLPQAAAPAANVVVDEEAMMKAQKHARWAISALNFEDVPTAIREFQAALQTLGAR